MWYLVVASSEEAGDLAVTSGKLSPLDDYDDDSAPGNIAVSRAINTACRKAILGQVRSFPSVVWRAASDAAVAVAATY